MFITLNYHILAFTLNYHILTFHTISKINLKLCQEFFKENFNINLVFHSFTIKNDSSYKEPIPNDLKSFLLYKFTCANCSSSYNGKIVFILN